MYCPRYPAGSAIARRAYLIGNCESGSCMPLYIVACTELFVLNIQVCPKALGDPCPSLVQLGDGNLLSLPITFKFHLLSSVDLPQPHSLELRGSVT